MDLSSETPGNEQHAVAPLSRPGERWSTAEYAQLVEEIRSALAVDEIATAHGRPPEGITAACNRLLPTEQRPSRQSRCSSTQLPPETRARYQQLGTPTARHSEPRSLVADNASYVSLPSRSERTSTAPIRRSRPGLPFAVRSARSVVIGGGLAQAGDALFIPLRERLGALLSFHRRPLLLPAQIGENAGLIGAALRARAVVDRGATPAAMPTL